MPSSSAFFLLLVGFPNDVVGAAKRLSTTACLAFKSPSLWTFETSVISDFLVHDAAHYSSMALLVEKYIRVASI